MNVVADDDILLLAPSTSVSSLQDILMIYEKELLDSALLFPLVYHTEFTSYCNCT